MVNCLNTKTHSLKEMTEFCFENAVLLQTEDKKRTVTFFRMCQKKLCKSCTSFTSHLHSLCGMVWYRTWKSSQWTRKSVQAWDLIPAVGVLTACGIQGASHEQVTSQPCSGSGSNQHDCSVTCAAHMFQGLFLLHTHLLVFGVCVCVCVCVCACECVFFHSFK